MGTAKLRDRQFRTDIEPLLAAGQAFDADAAARAVLGELVARLPGAPWRRPEWQLHWANGPFDGPFAESPRLRHATRDEPPHGSGGGRYASPPEQRAPAPGWFIESLATQTLVIFVIRTADNPVRSRPSTPLLASVFASVLVLLEVTYLGLVQLLKGRFYAADGTSPPALGPLIMTLVHDILPQGVHSGTWHQHTRSRKDMHDHTGASRGTAVRAGWNDAAWGQSRRNVLTAVGRWYEQGYAGGLIYRRKRPQDTSEQDLSRPAPQGVPAG